MEINPQLERKAQLKKSLTKAEGKVEDLKKKAKDVMAADIPRLVSQIDDIDNNSSGAKEQFSQIKKKVKEDEAKIKREVSKMEVQKKKADELTELMIEDGLLDAEGVSVPVPGMGRMKQVHESRAQINREIQEARSAYDDLKTKQNEIDAESEALRKRRDLKDQELQGMSNVKNVLVDKLRRTSRKVLSCVY